MTFIKSRSQELDIPEGNPFENDKLGRSQFSNILTDVVSFYGQTGCVLALGGEWGTGKTTFVKMWRQALNNKGFKTLYFNAWASDYTEDPLMALIAELSELSADNGTINKIASGAVRIGVSVLKTVLKGALKKTTGIDEAGITRDPSTWERPAPTMQRVVDKYLEGDVKKDTVYSVFRMLQDYQIFTNDMNNCVTMFEWLKSVQVIDLTLYEDDIKKLIVSLVLDVFYAEMKQLKGSDQKDGFREIRTMILVDEAHQFMKMKFNSLRKIISEGRMFGVGMILSTQGMSDFKTDEDYSTFIKSWVVHNVTNPTKSDLASIFGTSDPNLERYISYITNAVTFQSISKLGNQVNYIEDVPYFKLIENDDRFK